jgi:hypothetical protein
MTVDDATLAILKKTLINSDDYTYLIIKTTTTYEIVKATGFTGNTVNIARAQDDTTAQAFSTGTEVDFVMGDSAIADIINEKMLGQIDIIGGGMVTVTKLGTNSYQISAPPIAITSDSDKVLVGGEFPNFVLSAPAVSGCCD